MNRNDLFELYKQYELLRDSLTAAISRGDEPAADSLTDELSDLNNEINVMEIELGERMLGGKWVAID